MCTQYATPHTQKPLELIQIEERAIQELKAMYAEQYEEADQTLHIYRVPYRAPVAGQYPPQCHPSASTVNPQQQQHAR